MLEPFLGYRGEVGLPVHEKTRQGSKMWWLQSETTRGESIDLFRQVYFSILRMFYLVAQGFY